MYVSMKGMLQRANAGNYAVMAINCFNIETARAVISAAQELRAPIIVNIVQEHMVNHCDSELIAPIVKLLAQRASVEVALNFDHGEEIGYLKKALQDGYSSVMVDASRYDFEGNIRMTREIVEFAKQFDASVEGEIGCMGGSEGGNYTSDAMKTDPQQALRFAKETGIDALAISFGSSHLTWLYKGIQEGSNCIGYHVWTGIDCWSWLNAYKNRYGLISLDLKTQKRTIKKSGYWFRELAERGGFE